MIMYRQVGILYKNGKLKNLTLKYFELLEFAIPLNKFPTGNYYQKNSDNWF